MGFTEEVHRGLIWSKGKEKKHGSMLKWFGGKEEMESGFYLSGARHGRYLHKITTE